MKQPVPRSFIDGEYVMHIVQNGSFSFSNQVGSYNVSAGDVILIPPNALHALSNARPLHMLVVHFSDLSHELDLLKLPSVVRFGSTEFDQMRYLARLMAQAWANKDSFSELFSEGILQAAIGLYLRESKDHQREAQYSTSSPSWSVLEKGIAYMQEHFRNPDISGGEISTDIGVSYSYFCTIFRHYTNDTPRRYMNRLKIEAAKEAMFNQRQNASEAALSSGFRSVQYFTTVFKRFEHITPAKWRNKAVALGEVAISRHGGYKGYDG